ncbi:MAG: NB-ARC domain-containing protein, partial [Cyanobacteria bacterium P01_A01_bin.17]
MENQSNQSGNNAGDPKRYGPKIQKRVWQYLMLLRQGAEEDKLNFADWDSEQSFTASINKIQLKRLLDLGESEYWQAREFLRCLQVFLKISTDLATDKQKSQGLWKFSLDLTQVSTQEDFDALWSKKLAALRGIEQTGIKLPFNYAPNLPANYVERPEDFTAVKLSLLEDEFSELLVISAIYGMGGIGKSVLASALARDSEIQARFKDGILWTTLGQNPDVLSLLTDWIQVLGDYNFKPTSTDIASGHLRTLLSSQEKSILLVVDDLWKTEDFLPFQIGNSNCRLLVTTREAVIPGKPARHDLDVIDPEQALQLVKNTLDQELLEEELADVEALAKSVGYLPLALELLAAQRNSGQPWARLRQAFEQEYNRRFKILQQINAQGQGQTEKIRHLSLEVSFSLSLQRLKETHPEYYDYFLWFGVLPDDVLIIENMAATLWDCDPFDAGYALATLRARALLQDGKTQGDTLSYRLHDLMHDYARKLLTTDREVVFAEPCTLPGLGLTLEAAQQEFLQRYANKTQKDSSKGNQNI